ncbi:hypothetical protein CMI41_00340 [Candidatus Pacearchaeota archaeon]|nr:hypothetical protein [Candidatus Pacearchaeota archaeon]|tara:strand:+ start:3434 stop:4147 length:714 start_codon:yes stop_codon:yes gene_type:complete
MPLETGRAVQDIVTRHLINPGFGLEIFYAFIIIACSLMIYFGTKELYELSSHKGIKYFRQAFLFFALAYFSRIFIKFLLSYSSVAQVLDVSTKAWSGLLALIALPFFMYFSAMAVFSLVFSVAWKKLPKKGITMSVLKFVAVFLALIVLFFRNSAAYLFINLILFFLVLIVVFMAKKSKSKYSLYTTYVLLLVFWILNILDILVPWITVGFQLVLYIVSSGIFLMILYKVLRRTGAS